MAQVLSLEIIEGPGVHLKHTVAVEYAESFQEGPNFDFVTDFATSSPKSW